MGRVGLGVSVTSVVGHGVLHSMQPYQSDASKQPPNENGSIKVIVDNIY